MSNARTLLVQVYHPSDSEEMTGGKLARLFAAAHQVSHDPGQAWEILIRKYAKPRSNPANNYLFGVCYGHMSDASGYDKDELHDLMCKKHFGTRIVEFMGVKKSVPARTTTTNENGDPEVLPVPDFAEFVDFVIREAAMHLDLAIPPPTKEQVPRGE